MFKEPQLPDASFGDLFEKASGSELEPREWVTWEWEFPNNPRRPAFKNHFKINIGSYCVTRMNKGPHLSLYLRATPMLHEWIMENMLAAGEGDSIGFQMIQRSDGTVLFTADNSTIIGGRWLRLFDAMPAEVQKIIDAQKERVNAD